MEIPLLCLMCEAKLSLCMVFSLLVFRAVTRSWMFHKRACLTWEACVRCSRSWFSGFITYSWMFHKRACLICEACVKCSRSWFSGFITYSWMFHKRACLTCEACVRYSRSWFSGFITYSWMFHKRACLTCEACVRCSRSWFSWQSLAHGNPSAVLDVRSQVVVVLGFFAPGFQGLLLTHGCPTKVLA